MAANFRAIIVGGGLVGLTAAHVFSKAGIDFIMLEKHDTPLSTYGSAVALWPQSLRVFDQLGLLDAVQPILDHANQGFVLSTKDALILNKDRTRPDLVKFLYENLADSSKAKILLKKKATSIAVSGEMVKVFCDDGTFQEGSIVIGADGVHSQTRLLMQAIKTAQNPDDLSDFQKYPYKLTYRVYLGMCPILPGLPTNTRYEGTGNGVSSQIINGTDKAWFAIYEQLDSPRGQRRRYTEADKEDFLHRRSSLYMAPGWKLRDVDSQRTGEAALIDLEEGLVDEWFHHRIVLVGDAVRKFAPHAGLGYNSGVTDVVVLVNGLRRLLQANESPSTRDFDDLFRAYQAERAKDTQGMERISMKAARVLAWPTWKYKMLATYIRPYLPLGKISMTSMIPWRTLPVLQAKEEYHQGMQLAMLQPMIALVIPLLFVLGLIMLGFARPA